LLGGKIVFMKLIVWIMVILCQFFCRKLKHTVNKVLYFCRKLKHTVNKVQSLRDYSCLSLCLASPARRHCELAKQSSIYSYRKLKHTVNKVQSLRDYELVK
jgi:hypothetical protein